MYRGQDGVAVECECIEDVELMVDEDYFLWLQAQLRQLNSIIIVLRRQKYKSVTHDVVQITLLQIIINIIILLWITSHHQFTHCRHVFRDCHFHYATLCL